MKKVFEIDYASVGELLNFLNHGYQDCTLDTVKGHRLFIVKGIKTPRDMYCTMKSYKIHLSKMAPDEIVCGMADLIPDEYKSKVSKATLQYTSCVISYRKIEGKHYIQLTYK